MTEDILTLAHRATDDESFAGFLSVFERQRLAQTVIDLTRRLDGIHKDTNLQTVMRSLLEAETVLQRIGYPEGEWIATSISKLMGRAEAAERTRDEARKAIKQAAAELEHWWEDSRRIYTTIGILAAANIGLQPGETNTEKP